jgi:hypothetical protein
MVDELFKGRSNYMAVDPAGTAGHTRQPAAIKADDHETRAAGQASLHRKRDLRPPRTVWLSGRRAGRRHPHGREETTSGPRGRVKG